MVGQVHKALQRMEGQGKRNVYIAACRDLLEDWPRIAEEDQADTMCAIIDALQPEGYSSSCMCDLWIRLSHEAD